MNFLMQMQIDGAEAGAELLPLDAIFWILSILLL